MGSTITSQFGTGWVAAFGLVLGLFGSCTRRTVPEQAGPAPLPVRYFIDLKPGWRLRVVAPILKSGGYRLKTDGMEAGPDFLGYEVSWYAVKTRRIVFTGAEVHHKDEVVSAAQPMAPLFRFPENARYVRLIYLVRISEADHDMAVVAANRKAALDPLTAQVRANPRNCRPDREAFCAWIPDGIAVTPEMRTTATGAEQWAPAN